MTRSYTARSALWLLSALLFGCGAREFSVLEPAVGNDAGEDGGDTLPDAGDTQDAGGTQDASAPDAGEPDAGGVPLPPSLAAFEHTCASLEGALYCWGDNLEGQLGVGDLETRSAPVRVGAEQDVMQVCAGEAHSCALHGTGELTCWGENLHGALGLGDTLPRQTPAPIERLRFSRVACGGSVTCALDLTGALYCWGDNFEGQLGQGDPFQSPDVLRPTPVAPALSFREVTVGQGHVCAITRQGVLYCWGRNSTSQLGLGDGAPAQVRVPRLVDSTLRFQSVSAGQSHTCAIAREGSLLCWGTDQMGTLGQGLPSGAVVTTPSLVDTASYTRVRASWFHTCALRTDHTLSCWGRNTEGQLGLGDREDRNVPVRVGLGVAWRDVSLGRFHSCGVLGADVFCWGENNEFHQLGLGEQSGRRDEPTLVTLPQP